MAGQYNETQVRREFIDPFLKELGWDIDNEQGYAEAYKDVVHEDAIRIGGMHKAPDYCMRIGGVRKFFVEAKKPAVNVKENSEPAFQVRRYAWSAKLPLSILTDFQELAVYDCRLKPTKTDGSTKARIQYFTYKDYIEKWDEIASIFSRDAVLKGSFDKYAEATKKNKGTEEVDEAFLKEIENWREILAKNIAIRNPDLSQRELNFAVQVTIDRLVFLRICEDRGIENYGRLLAEVNGTNIYGRLKQHFRDADDRYNSGLFHFENEKDQSESPDTLTLGLQIDDDVLKEIISHLYYPESPYEFSVLSADILGQVYEQFLGKVIRLTDGHRAKIEEKPEVRKAGGVYYTPTYIVQYIVEHTIGKLVEGKTPKEVEKLKICDPACGSGSFLLGAYQFLLDWHLKYYMDNDPNKWNKQLTQSAKGDWRLSTTERKRILLNNIFGVDIDAQAVEVTKLSLLLKVLEGETEQSLKPQLSMFKERALPNLGSNIKCGNSLIGPDFFMGQQMGLLETEEQYRINVFDWEKAFPQILTGKNAGFDAIIGNPPYIRIQAMKEWAPIEVEYYKKRYASASKGNYDIYVVFIERALALMNQKGVLGYILPHKFFNAHYGEPVREMLSKGKNLQQIVHFGDQQVFKGASTYTCLLFLTKAGQNKFSVTKVDHLDDWRLTKAGVSGDISANWIDKTHWQFTVGKSAELFDELKQMPSKLENVTLRIFQGLKTSADKIYIVEERERKSDRVKIYSPMTGQEHWVETELLHPLIKGGDSKPYQLTRTNRLILFPYKSGALIPQSEFEEKYPLTWQYFIENKPYLSEREDGKMLESHWYAFGRNQALEVIGLPKIFTPDIAPRASFSLDETGDVFFTGGAAGGYGIIVKPEYSREYILGLLNSKLLEWYLRQIATQMRGGWFSFESRFIKNLPIWTDFSDSREEGFRDSIITLVGSMLDLQKQLALAKTPHEQSQINQLISMMDESINDAVFELYGLSDDEVEMIKSSFKKQ